LIASLSSGPIDGAFVMLSFGLASSVSLYAGGWLWRMFLESNQATQSSSHRGVTGAWQRGLMSFRLAGASVVGAGAWSLFNMLSAVASPGVQCG
jgi:sulfite exporter TauE/SafE